MEPRQHEHWYWWGTVLLALGIAMLAVGTALATPPRTANLWTTWEAEGAYLAFLLVAFSGLAGARGWRFPLSAGMRVAQERTVEIGQQASAADRVALLRAQYDAGNKLRPQLIWPPGGIPADSREQAEQIVQARAAVCAWARDTWIVLREHFQGFETDFYGAGNLTDDSLFLIMCVREMKRRGIDHLSYFDERMLMVAELLRRFDAGEPRSALSYRQLVVSELIERGDYIRRVAIREF